MVHVVNGADGSTAPFDEKIEITSNVTGEIYEAFAKKDIQLINGIVAFGVSSEMKPSVNDPVKVNVEITALGFTPIHRQIAFGWALKQQVIELQLTKPEDTKALCSCHCYRNTKRFP